MAKTYLRFLQIEVPPTRKTQEWLVISLSSGDTLGGIVWRGQWRQYVFEPEPNTVWSDGCMAEVQTKIRELMAARRVTANLSHTPGTVAP